MLMKHRNQKRKRQMMEVPIPSVTRQKGKEEEGLRVSGRVAQGLCCLFSVTGFFSLTK